MDSFKILSGPGKTEMDIMRLRLYILMIIGWKLLVGIRPLLRVKKVDFQPGNFILKS